MNHGRKRTNNRLAAVLVSCGAMLLIPLAFAVPLTDSVRLVYLGWVGIVMLASSVASWALLRRELLGPYLALLVVAYAFMFGQSFLWALGLDAGSFDLRRMFSATQVVLAQTFTLFGLGMYHIGGLLAARRSYSEREYESRSPSRRYAQALRVGTKAVGYLLAVISAVPYVVITARRIRVASMLGYAATHRDALLTQTGVAGSLTAVANFFPLATIALLAGYHNRAGLRTIWVLMAAAMVVTEMYVGRRGQALVLASTFLLAWHYLVRPIRGRRAVTGIAVALVLAILIPVVGAVRSEENRSLREWLQGIRASDLRVSGLVAAIGEVGSSMFPLLATMELVPSEFPFRYGASYGYSLTTVIPNLGFWQVHPGYAYSTFGSWLADEFNLGYSPAFSWTAEAYVNFGWFGIGLMFVLGAMYGRVFSLVNATGASWRPDRAVFTLVLVSLVMLTTRNSFVATVRAFVYYAMPVYLAIRLFAASLRDKSQHAFPVSRPDT